MRSVLFALIAALNTATAAEWKKCTRNSQCGETNGKKSFCADHCFNQQDCEVPTSVCQPCTQCLLTSDAVENNCKEVCKAGGEYEYESYSESDYTGGPGNSDYCTIEELAAVCDGEGLRFDPTTLKCKVDVATSPTAPPPSAAATESPTRLPTMRPTRFPTTEYPTKSPTQSPTDFRCALLTPMRVKKVRDSRKYPAGALAQPGSFFDSKFLYFCGQKSEGSGEKVPGECALTWNKRGRRRPPSSSAFVSVYDIACGDPPTDGPTSSPVTAAPSLPTTAPTSAPSPSPTLFECSSGAYPVVVKKNFNAGSSPAGAFKDRYNLYFCAYSGSSRVSPECKLERDASVRPKTSRGRVKNPTSYYGLRCTDLVAHTTSPTAHQSAAPTSAPSSAPCPVVECGAGSELVGADERGCGGECVTAAPSLPAVTQPPTNRFGRTYEQAYSHCRKRKSYRKCRTGGYKDECQWARNRCVPR